MFCAKAVSDQFGPGLFQTYLELSCVPFLSEPMTSSSVSTMTNQLTVADVMARGVTALPPVIAMPELLHILKTTKYSVSVLPSCLSGLSSPCGGGNTIPRCCRIACFASSHPDRRINVKVGQPHSTTL